MPKITHENPSPFGAAAQTPFDASTPESPRPGNSGELRRTQRAPIDGSYKPPAQARLSDEQYQHVAREIFEQMKEPFAKLEQQVNILQDENSRLKEQLSPAVRKKPDSSPGAWKKIAGAVCGCFRSLTKHVPPVCLALAGFGIGVCIAAAMITPPGLLVVGTLGMCVAAAFLSMCLINSEPNQSQSSEWESSYPNEVPAPVLPQRPSALGLPPHLARDNSSPL
ncbi:MAG: hypothetical protein GZ090_08480 [Oxalobacteraceae bacterium]|nr:hypothetical protein [Oxalobacteraceae bacterium]